MALELSLSVSTEAADGTSITIADDTGTYDVSTNEGGYGSPNEERADLRLYMLPLKKAEDGSATVLDVDNDTAESVDSWEITLTSDGWHSFGVVAANPYSGSTDYSLLNIVYEDASNEIYICKKVNGPGSTVVAPSSDPTNEYWGTIDSGDIDVNKILVYPSTYGLVDSVILNKIIAGRSNKYYSVQVANACVKCNSSKNKTVRTLQLFLNAAIISGCVERYAEGERAILAFNEIANGGCGCV